MYGAAPAHPRKNVRRISRKNRRKRAGSKTGPSLIRNYIREMRLLTAGWEVIAAREAGRITNQPNPTTTDRGRLLGKYLDDLGKSLDTEER